MKMTPPYSVGLRSTPMVTQAVTPMQAVEPVSAQRSGINPLMMLTAPLIWPAFLGQAIGRSIPNLRSTGATIRETAEDISVGGAYSLGNNTGRVQSSAGQSVSTVKWVAIGAGVIVGGLVALKALETVREVFDNG